MTWELVEKATADTSSGETLDTIATAGNIYLRAKKVNSKLDETEISDINKRTKIATITLKAATVSD